VKKETLNALKKQIEFSCGHYYFQDCPYYPCHDLPEGQDFLNCMFCYCPFYPCGGKLGSGKWIKSGKGKKIWDCSKCSYIHSDEIVCKIMELLYEKNNFKKIKKILISLEKK
jgi:Zn-finger protein